MQYNHYLFLLLVGLLLATGGGRAHAIWLGHHDLDALVFQSWAIVEGVVTTPAAPRALARVRVATVYTNRLPARWGIKPDATILVDNTTLYVKDSPADGDATPLGAGDRVLLFLMPSPPPESGPMPEPPRYSVVSSGLRLVQGGLAINFQQMSNPGPYVMRPLSNSTRRYFMSHTEFVRRLRLEIAPMQALAQRFAAQPAATDVPWLLALLRQRAAHFKAARGATSQLTGDLQAACWLWGYDIIAEQAARRLADLHDRPALATALMLPLPGDCANSLAIGFSSPAGRDYLLQRVADRRAPLVQRQRFVAALVRCGADYPVGAGEKFTTVDAYYAAVKRFGNNAYLTRIARQAVAADETVAADEPEAIRLTLLRGLEKLIADCRNSTEPHVRTDLRAALGVLRRYYPAARSAAMRFYVEKATANYSVTASRRLRPQTGAMLCLLTPRPRVDPAGRARRLEFDAVLSPLNGRFIENGWAPTKGGFRGRAVVVLQNLATGRRIVLPSRLVITNQQFKGLAYDEKGKAIALPEAPDYTVEGCEHLVLPASVPPGNYRVYYRFVRGRKVIGTSHAFEARL